jgi:hypothetical protein
MRQSIPCPHCGSAVELRQDGESETNFETVRCHGCHQEILLDRAEYSTAVVEPDRDGVQDESASAIHDSSDPLQDMSPSLSDLESVPSDEQASHGGPAIVFSIDDDDSFDDRDPALHSDSRHFDGSLDSRYTTASEIEAPENQGAEDQGGIDQADVDQDEEIALELEADEEWETEDGETAHNERDSDRPIENSALQASDQEQESTNGLADESAAILGGDGSEADSQWQMLSSAGVRRQRPEASALRKILPPILGGLAAFPIATAIMWYGFGKDIGNTGQIVSEYAPWLVPSKLQKNRWQRSPNANRDNLSSRENQIGNSQRSGTSPIASGPSLSNLPKLNREGNASSNETADASPKSVDKEKFEPLTASNPPAESKPRALPESPSKNAEQSPAPELEPSKVSISSLIASMRKHQDGWYGTPKDKQIPLIKEYYGTAQQLSEQASLLKGRSAGVWRKELESLALEVLADKSFKAVMQRGPIGKLPGIPAAEEGAYLATVIELGEANEPDANKTWTVQEKWKGADGEFAIDVLPGAWRVGSANLPALCLVLGRIVRHDANATSVENASDSNPESTTASNTSEELRLQVHALLPLR